MRGIDISRWNSSPFNNVTQKGYNESDFVVIKVTSGSVYDYIWYFHKYAPKVLADGKLLGAYHYAEGEDPILEAKAFVKEITPYIGKALLALDWEPGDNRAWGSTTWCSKFINYVYEQTGVVCLLYTGLDGVRQNASLVDICPLWFAGYPIGANSWDVPPWPARYNISPWQKYTIWQFTSGNNTLDRDITFLSKAQWLELAQKEDKMKVVKVGSARIDERGNASGGKAGDQNGSEVAVENWYRHPQGWVSLRAKDPDVAEKIAYAMDRACANPNIGYDQKQRNTLYELAELVRFDPGAVDIPCETDCSALVRVCLAYAGIHVKDFNTSTEKITILNTGEFEEVPATKENTKRGDILVTKTKGHTVVVVKGNKDADPVIFGEDEMQGLVVEEMKTGPNKVWYYNIETKLMLWVPNPDCLTFIKNEYKRTYGKDLQTTKKENFEILKKIMKAKTM